VMGGGKRIEAPVLRDGAVTALIARGGSSERVAVHIDGRRAFDLASQLADGAGLRVGAAVTAEQQQELIDRDAPYRARERAVRLLGARDRSRREIETRLRQAGFEAPVIAEAVAWLMGLGYLDDRRFAGTYAAEKRRAGWAPQRIRAELAAKGVERRVVEEALAVLEDGMEEETATAADEALERTVRQRFVVQFGADPPAAERRLAGFLARRGYDWDTIRRMARMLRSEAGAEDRPER
jgi:regulatory protein